MYIYIYIYMYVYAYLYLSLYVMLLIQSPTSSGRAQGGDLQTQDRLREEVSERVANYEAKKS